MVDDDEDDCILVEAALEEAHFNCTFRCIQDGCEMMDYLNRSGRYCNPEAAPIPDLILLDLNMPKMNGRDVLKLLKTSPGFRSIPVIILTTSADMEDVKICYDLGANSYITKHSSFDGLRSAIETIKEYWIDVATLPPKTGIQRCSEAHSKP
jgi:two-component system response regulator